MLKILFSPAEIKISGGDVKAKKLLGSDSARKNILDAYHDIIKKDDEEKIKNLFGFKKFSDCKEYINSPFDSAFMYAIQRYRGVAYDYLEFNTLNKDAQEYIKRNTIIFSNLYGPIYAGDVIANYKVKQGNNIGDIAPDKFYKDRFSYQLDLLLRNDDILDLRAGYYNKFYKITKAYTALKFLKNGKTVSHWAKAYRGLVLKAVAQNNIQSIEEFMSLEIKNLQVKEIKIIKNKTEIIYNIID